MNKITQTLLHYSLVFALSIGIFSYSSFADTRVVVIPLFGDDAAKFEPYAPLSRNSQGTSQYTVTDDTVFDKRSTLEWERKRVASERIWSSAWSYCMNLQLGGENDWRLPSAKELLSIVSFSNKLPAINYITFPDTTSAQYWSATNAAPDSNDAWVIYFNNGRARYLDKNIFAYTRCVRNHSPEGPLFSDNTDGTVTDMATGRIWQKQDDNIHKTWQEAKDYCTALVLGNSDRWYLPIAKDLFSIVDHRLFEPAIDKTVFTSAHQSGYWSLSSDAFYSPTFTNGWVVDFTDGEISSNNKSIRNHFARCVRVG